jgi:hypothetical protein
MKNGNPQTPFQEALSMICIASVLVGLGCYVAAINEVPLVSEFLFNVAVQVYHRLPVLNTLHAPQAPMLVGALTIGTVFFIFTIPLLTGWRACSAEPASKAWNGRQPG